MASAAECLPAGNAEKDESDRKEVLEECAAPAAAQLRDASLLEDGERREAGFCLANVPPEVLLGPNGGSMHYYENSKGLKLCSYWWPAVGEAKASVIAVHGNGVYLPFAFLKFKGPGQASEYAGSWVEALNQRGFSVAGIDMQSCGRSEGLHGLDSHLESYEDLVHDELGFVHLVRASSDPKFSQPPVFLLGASLGGCIATLCALSLQAEPWFRGCVGMAPMLSLERASKQGLNPILEPIARQIAYMWPSLPVVGGNRLEMETRIPHLLAGYEQDPGVYSGATRLGTAAQFLDACAHVMAAAPQATFPTLIFHAPDDTLTDPIGSREFLEASSSEDKRYVAAVGMWHDLIQEPGNEAILPQVIEWLEERVDKPPLAHAQSVDALAIQTATLAEQVPTDTTPATAIQTAGVATAAVEASAGATPADAGPTTPADPHPPSIIPARSAVAVSVCETFSSSSVMVSSKMSSRGMHVAPREVIPTVAVNADTPVVLCEQIDIQGFVERAKIERNVSSVVIAMQYGLPGPVPSSEVECTGSA